MAYIDINDSDNAGGDATAANQVTEINLLTSIDGKTPTLGQKTMAGSSPVVIASDQSGVPVKVEDGSGTPITSTASGPKQGLDVNVVNSTSSGVADKTAFVYGTTSEQPIGGVFQDTSPGLTSGTTGAIRVTQNRGLHTNLRDNSGTELGTGTNPVRVDPTGTTPQPVSGTVAVSNFPATQPVSGTVTANQGAPNTAANGWPVKPTDGTNSQSYTAGGAAKVDGSATTQPISAVSLPLPTGASTAANQTTANTSLASIDSKLNTLGQKTSAASVPVVIASDQSAVPVTANAGTGTFQTNLAQVGGAAIALGQQLAAGSIPVVTQADALPATQNITAQDVASTITAFANGQNFITGTPTAGSAASFTFSSFDSVEVQVTGTWTGTLQSEFSIDGGTTWFTRGIKQAGVGYVASSFTANFAGGANIAGATNYRVRATAAWTGTATVKIVLTINPASITVSNALTLRDGTTQSITDTIKAASTAAVATDTALVVAISPNTALNLPTGASTAANQTTANTTLASILANQTNGTQVVEFGTNPGIAFGEVALAAATEAAVRSTPYTEQTTNAQRSIVSNNTFDNPFFGVGNVKITYFDQTGAGPFTETLAPNGTTAVNTVNTNICYIEKIEIVPLSNTTSNAPLGVFGTITLWSATGATGTVIATFGGTTSGHTEWAHHYVAIGKTCRITSIDVSSSGNAAGEGSVFRMKSKVILGTNASEQQISPYLSIEGVSTSTNTREFMPPYPIQVVGPARITMYSTPNAATANTQRACFTWLEY